VDYYVSEVLRLLEENGHTENTLVVFSSDHGPSDLFRGKTTSYEFGLKVPFIAKWPGVIQGNQRSKAMVSFVDIMPTFLDVAGIDRPEWLPGASIVPVFRGETPNGHRKYLYSAYNSHTTRKDLFWPGRTINDGRYKLIHHLLADGELAREGKQGANARFVGMLRSTEEMKKLYTETVTPPSYQLYDLQSDPAELNDLSKNPEYAPVLARLKKDLFKWRKDIVKDPFVDEEVLKDFTEEYYAHCQIFEDMMEKHGKKGLQKMKWKLDKERWIPVWNPAPYGPEH
jgi:N-sulfoglucosamine sulfohydrolase